MATLKDRYQVTNVFVSAVTRENISRQQLLAWVNDLLQSSYTKIEEMSKAAAYCLLTDRLFPGSIPLHKVKWNPRSELEVLSNWKLVQNAWAELGIDKPVHVQMLMKGKFQDNFEFLQWFRRFYDHNNVGYEYDPLEARNHEAMPSSSAGPTSRASVAAAPRPAAAAAAPRRSMGMPPARPPPTATTTIRQSLSNTSATARPLTSNTQSRSKTDLDHNAEILKLKKKNEELSANNEELKEKLTQYETTADRIETERDDYYRRLFALEEACKDQPADAVLTCGYILNIIYDSVPSDEIQAFEQLEVLSNVGEIADSMVSEDAAAAGEPQPTIKQQQHVESSTPQNNGHVAAAASAAIHDEDDVSLIDTMPDSLPTPQLNTTITKEKDDTICA